MHSHLLHAAVIATGLFTIAATGCSANSQPSPEPTSAAREPTRDGDHGGILARLPSQPTVSASTVPDSGDVNPYGVAFVPDGFPGGGPLHAGDVLVSNFNDSANLQGTGTTVVRVNASASPTLFFHDDGAPGLSTALGVLRNGFVLVGNLPSADGSGSCTGEESNVGQGAILVLDRHGNLVSTLTSASLLDGPWDMAVDDEGSSAHVFVSNALQRHRDPPRSPDGRRRRRPRRPARPLGRRRGRRDPDRLGLRAPLRSRRVRRRPHGARPRP